MNTNLNKYGIPILEKKEVNTKQICSRIISDSIRMEEADVKIEDLDCDAFRDFYGFWRGKDIKSLIAMEAE